MAGTGGQILHREPEAARAGSTFSGLSRNVPHVQRRARPSWRFDSDSECVSSLTISFQAW